MALYDEDLCDEDLIARIYPHERSAMALRVLFPDSGRHPSPDLSQSSRETTPDIEEGFDPEKTPCVELRFSRGPRNRAGFVFGKSSTSDIVLKDKGVSNRHFAITYSDKFEDRRTRLVVRDLGSTRGTNVSYVEERSDWVRKDFTWIISEFPLGNPEKGVVLAVADLKFRVVAADHKQSPHTFISNVERFWQGTALIEDIEVDRTMAQTHGHTPPTNEPIILHLADIAKGGFGLVTRCWDVSTGKEYARKEPRGWDSMRRTQWEGEIEMQSKLEHDHIAKLCHWTLHPVPLLYLDYLPLGSLRHQGGQAAFSRGECFEILRQGLSALQYLDALSVTHRDIKPENILVQQRGEDKNPSSLHVRLSDFGLSKDGSVYQTWCGTDTYMAYELSCGTYTRAVDIWALGVVVLEYAYSLPPPGKLRIMANPKEDLFKWCVKVGNWVLCLNASDRLAAILQRMLAWEAEDRPSPTECLEMLDESHRESPRESPRERSATPTQASVAAAYGAPAHRSSPDAQEAEEQSTWRNLPTAETGRSPAVTVVRKTSTTREVVSQASLGYQETSQAWQSQADDSQSQADDWQSQADDWQSQADDWQSQADDWTGLNAGSTHSNRDLDALSTSSRAAHHSSSKHSHPRPDPGNEYMDNGYASLCHGPHTIVYKPTEEVVNANHLLKMGGRSLQECLSGIGAFFKQYPSIVAKTVVSRGKENLRGTYISFADAVVFCQYFDLDAVPVQKLLQDAKTMTFNSGPNGMPSWMAPQDHHPQPRQPADQHYSAITEPSYRHGSYLAPANHSYKQLLN